MIYVPYYNPGCLSISVTNYCNLNCTMCFRRGLSISEGKQKHMELKTFKKILDDVAPTQIVCFIGLGEPLTNPDFLKMVEEANKRGLVWNFATNGMLLDKKTSQKICVCGEGKVSVSLDGAKKETYEKIRKGASFDEVTFNLRQFSQIKSEIGAPITLRLDVVGMKQNIAELPDMIRLAHSVGADGVNLLHLQALTKELAEQHLHLMPKEIVEKYYNEAISVASRLGIQLILKPLEPVLAECVSPWADPYIEVDGTVTACCLAGLPTDKPVTEYYLDAPVELDPKKLRFGNVLKEDFKKIWAAQKYNDFRTFIYGTMVEDSKIEWDRKKYLELRKKHSNPFNYCQICARRFRVVC